MRWSRLIGFLGFLSAMMLVLYLTTRTTPRPPLGPAGAASFSGALPGLGEPPPPEVARDPRAAKRYIEQQDCLAACAMEARTCESTAEDEPGEGRCHRAREQCDARCRDGGPG